MNYGRNWRLIQDPPQEAFTNMAVDEAIARALVGSDNGSVPTLRIYAWNPNSVSIGYFQRISDVATELRKNPGCHSGPPKGGEESGTNDRFFASLRMTARHRYTFPEVLADDIGLKDSDNNYDIVRRPTGGTAVMHDGGPSFSLVLKGGAHTPSMNMKTNIIDLYSLMGRCVVEALRRQGVSAELWDGPKGTSNNPNLCISNLCPYDVVSQGRKLAGYAARRLQGVTLVQGYITLSDGLTAQDLRDAITCAVEDLTGARLMDGSLTEEEATLATKLQREKYTHREWNYKR